MTDNDNDLQRLFDLHKFIGSLICDEIGHDWREVTTDSSDLGMRNAVAGWEKCARCKDTRQDLGMSTTSTNTDVEFTVSTSE